MEKMYVYVAMGLSLATTTVSAQKVNTDSLKLVSAISKDQLHLGELQNKIPGKTQDKIDAAQKAQSSANDNQKIAGELSSDPQNKRLARQASRMAHQAKKDARKARSAAADLDDLNKDIAKTQKKIGNEQTKLNKYVPASTGIPAPTTPPARTDSTQH
jgi:cell division septum initiation protein DivIVA